MVEITRICYTRAIKDSLTLLVYNDAFYFSIAGVTMNLRTLLHFVMLFFSEILEAKRPSTIVILVFLNKLFI